MSGDICGCHDWGLLALRGWGPRRLLHTPQWPGRPPTENDQAMSAVQGWGDPSRTGLGVFQPLSWKMYTVLVSSGSSEKHRWAEAPAMAPVQLLRATLHTFSVITPKGPPPGTPQVRM